MNGWVIQETVVGTGAKGNGVREGVTVHYFYKGVGTLLPFVSWDSDPKGAQVFKLKRQAVTEMRGLDGGYRGGGRALHVVKLADAVAERNARIKAKEGK